MAQRDDHSSWEELAVAYALSATEPADDEAVVEHLRGCAHCTRTVAETRDVMAELVQAVDEVEPARPPASLRSRIVTRAKSDPDGVAAVSDVGAAGPPARTPSQTERVSRNRKGARGRVPWYALAASITVVLVLLASNVFLLRESGTQRARLARASRVVECVKRRDCQALPMRATEGAGAPAVALVASREVRLLVSGLSANDPASTKYVLWQKSRDSLKPVTTFDVTATGVTVVEAGELGQPLSRTTFLAISRESGDEPLRAPSTPLAVSTVSAQAPKDKSAPRTELPEPGESMLDLDGGETPSGPEDTSTTSPQPRPSTSGERKTKRDGPTDLLPDIGDTTEHPLGPSDRCRGVCVGPPESPGNRGQKEQSSKPDDPGNDGESGQVGAEVVVSPTDAVESSLGTPTPTETPSARE